MVSNEDWAETREEMMKEADIKGQYQKYYKDRKFQPQILGDELIKKYIFKCPKDAKKLYVYNEKTGQYENNGNISIETKCKELMGGSLKKNQIDEVCYHIKVNSYCDETKFYEEKEGLILMNNCIYDLKNHKVLKFNPEHFFLNKISLNYNPKSKCPIIIDFLEQVFYEDDLQIIQEFCGYLFFNRQFKKNFLTIQGPKNTGKTVFLNLLTKFIGENNVSGLSMHEVVSSKSFDRLRLFKKFVNIYDDLSSKDIESVGALKQVVGDSFVEGEQKFGNRIRFRNYAKLIFTCNQIPTLKDDKDSAYWDRVIIIMCNNIIPKEEQDDELITKLTTEEELSGFFNWAMEGLKRLQKKGFSYDKTEEEKQKLANLKSDSITSFIEECLEEKVGNKISKADLFLVYKKYCEVKKLRTFTLNLFSRKIKQKVNYAADSRSSVRYWINIIVKPINIDTYDTFIQTYKRHLSNNIKRVSKKASNASYLLKNLIIKRLLEHSGMSRDELYNNLKGQFPPISVEFFNGYVEKMLAEGLVYEPKKNKLMAKEENNEN